MTRVIAARCVSYPRKSAKSVVEIFFGGGSAALNPQQTLRETLLHSATNRRGTAEIELLLCCVVLITLLLLTAGLLKIGAARLSNSQASGFAAFQNATAGVTPVNWSTSSVPTFPTAEQLPSRVHTSPKSTQVTVMTGAGSSFNATVVADAAVISPPWIYGAYPVAGDQSLNQQWFENLTEPPRAGLSDPLGLSASWPP